MHWTPSSTLPTTPPAARSGATRRHVALLLLSVLLGGQGCYSYHVVELQGVTPGEEIRVQLGEAEYRRVAPGGGAAGPRRVEGRFASVTPDTLVMSVWIGKNFAGTPFASSYQDIQIPRGDIEVTENRQLSKGRTTLVGVGMAALIVVLIDSIGLVQVFGSGGDGGPPLPPAGTLIGR